MASLAYTIPGLGTEDSVRLVESLQDRLHAMNDLHLTLKHAHWNVTGPHFIAVHEMLDPQVDLVRGYADELAEQDRPAGWLPRRHAGPIGLRSQLERLQPRQGGHAGASAGAGRGLRRRHRLKPQGDHPGRRARLDHESDAGNSYFVNSYCSSESRFPANHAPECRKWHNFPACLALIS